MKKRSFQRTSSGSVPGKGVVAGVALLVLLVLLALLRFVFPDAFFALARPFWNAGTAASGAFGSALPHADAGALSRELAEERANGQALSGEVARLSALNAELHRLIGDSSVTPSGVAASVIARPPFSAYDTLVVGTGSDAGVVVGAVVTAQGGIPIGIVESAAPRTSQVALFSVPGRATAAWAGSAHTPITLVGAGAGTFDANAPKDAVVAVGDSVVAPGGIPFARIVRIDENPSSPTKSLRIQSLVNANGLASVLIAR